MLKIIIGLFLLAHGIGHSMGILQVLKVSIANPQWHGDSWLLSPIVGTTPAQVVAVAVWTGAIIGFAALAATVVGWLPAAWWQPLAIGAALASLIGLVLFPAAFPPFSTLGALAVNVAVLVSVLWYGWAPSDLPA